MTKACEELKDVFLNCNKCKNSFPTSNFYRDRSRKRGFMLMCKECDGIRQKKRDWSNRDWSYRKDFEHIKSRATLRDAIRRGKVNKYPCVECGEKKSQGHHPDYSKPLEVVWLCQTHHTKLHKKLKLLQPLEKIDIRKTMELITLLPH